MMILAEAKAKPTDKKTDPNKGMPWTNGKAGPDMKTKNGDKAQKGATKMPAMTKGKSKSKAK